TIVSDVNAQAATIASFPTAIPITGSFFAGIEIYYATGDTAVLLSNRDGNTPGGTTWVQFSDNSWNEFSDTNVWGLNTSLYVMPVICTTVANEVKFVGNVSIYPNPNDGTFTLAMTKVTGTAANVKVFNLQGQAVFQNSLNIENGAAAQTFNLSHLANGTYFVQIESNGSRTNHKIVIAK
ncbi:MAG: T9SS type A sorting domain-containing protein, partial [Bacteroidia bacterium]